MAKQITSEEVDSFIRQLKWLLAAAFFFLFVPLIVYVFFSGQQVHSLEDTLKHSPPRDLDSDDIDRDSLFHLSRHPVLGQVVYVPAYSHVYHGDGKPRLLTITLSVRNTSQEEQIFVRSVRYFNTKGKEVRSYLPKPVRLVAMATTEVLVEKDDASGGSGASFLVEWYSTTPVTEPIIEAVMIDTDSQQGISFARRGSVVSEVAPTSAEESIEANSPE